jgi:hypothetical protein
MEPTRDDATEAQRRRRGLALGALLGLILAWIGRGRGGG